MMARTIPGWPARPGSPWSAWRTRRTPRSGRQLSARAGLAVGVDHRRPQSEGRWRLPASRCSPAAPAPRGRASRSAPRGAVLAGMVVGWVARPPDGRLAGRAGAQGWGGLLDAGGTGRAGGGVLLGVAAAISRRPLGAGRLAQVGRWPGRPVWSRSVSSRPARCSARRHPTLTIPCPRQPAPAGSSRNRTGATGPRPTAATTRVGSARWARPEGRNGAGRPGRIRAPLS